MKIKISGLICSLFALGGCAQSSGVLKLGPDTYTVQVHAAPARGGEAGARTIALTEANQHCMAQGKEILVTNTSSRGSTHLPGGTMTVTFQCLDKDDPDLRRPRYEAVPSAVIEDRRQ